MDALDKTALEERVTEVDTLVKAALDKVIKIADTIAVDAFTEEKQARVTQEPVNGPSVAELLAKASNSVDSLKSTLKAL